MAELSDVKRWLVDRGVTHVVAGVNSGWAYTLCDSMFSHPGTVRTPKNMRLCRTCRQKLKAATVANPTPLSGEAAE